MTSKGTIRSFIVEHTGATELSDTDDIFERGLVSSMFVMQLVVFVETEFGIAVTGEELVFDNFRTVEAVDALVSGKLAA